MTSNPTTPSSIAIILPPREGFGPAHFGAVALCVKEFVEFSKFRANCTVYGAVDTPPFAGIPFTYVPSKPFLLGSQTSAYSKKLMAQIKQHPPKLIEVHNRPALATLLAKKCTQPVTLHLHNDPREMDGARKPQERQWLQQHCAAIYCVSNYIAQCFLEGVTDAEGKVHTVYNGVALPANFPPKKPQILFVGRMKPEKGALEFAQALAQILPGYKSWKGIMVGAERHQPDAKLSDYERKIQEVIAPLNGRIEMRGFLPYEETMQLYAESEIAMIPSLWAEPFGRTALEAMANGCAVISATKGGLREVVDESGLTLKTVTPDKLAAELRILLGNPLLRQEYAGKAISRAGRFDIRLTIQALDTVREGLLEK